MPDIAFTEKLAKCIRYMFIEVLAQRRATVPLTCLVPVTATRPPPAQGMAGLSLVMIVGAIYKLSSGDDNFHLMAAGEAFFVLWTMQALLVM